MYRRHYYQSWLNHSLSLCLSFCHLTLPGPRHCTVCLGMVSHSESSPIFKTSFNKISLLLPAFLPLSCHRQSPDRPLIIEKNPPVPPPLIVCIYFLPSVVSLCLSLTLSLLLIWSYVYISSDLIASTFPLLVHFPCVLVPSTEDSRRRKINRARRQETRKHAFGDIHSCESVM